MLQQAIISAFLDNLARQQINISEAE